MEIFGTGIFEFLGTGTKNIFIFFVPVPKNSKINFHPNFPQISPKISLTEES